jgi:hypothetical protein
LRGSVRPGRHVVEQRPLAHLARRTGPAKGCGARRCEMQGLCLCIQVQALGWRYSGSLARQLAEVMSPVGLPALHLFVVPWGCVVVSTRFWASPSTHSPSTSTSYGPSASSTPPPLAPSTSMLLRARVRVKRVLQNQKCSPGSRRGLTALSGVNHLDLRRDETPVRQGARVSDVPMVSSRNRTTARLPGETVTLFRYARSRAEVEFNWRRRLRSSCPRCTLGVPRRGPPA